MAGKRALISVSDKTHVVLLGKILTKLKFELVSTGNTAKELRAAGLEVTDVSSFTGSPEMLGGRVKTLHPHIHAGILFKRKDPAHKHARKYAIDLVCVNFYPFRETLEKTKDEKEIIEEIDIGGPTLVRAAAKNYEDVIILTSPAQYESVLSLMQRGGVPIEKRRELARQAFNAVSEYDAVISEYFNSTSSEQSSHSASTSFSRQLFPEKFSLSLQKLYDLRYGENPHQKAALYALLGSKKGFPALKQLHGKQLSYNNILDVQSALDMLISMRPEKQAFAAVFKHLNPSGAAKARTLKEAYLKAFKTDSLSAFGGVVACNRKVDAGTARSIVENFTEIVVAPGFDKDALSELEKKKSLRVIDVSDMLPGKLPDIVFESRSVFGGVLMQTGDYLNDEAADFSKFKLATKRKPTQNEVEAMRFAWLVCKNVKSNAVVFATPDHVIAIGAGQQSRVDSCQIAIEKAKRAGLNVKGTVMASDAFFPFRDTIDFAGKAGITAVIQPGGSIRDAEVIAAADEFKLAMVLTGIRHFRH